MRVFDDLIQCFLLPVSALLRPVAACQLFDKICWRHLNKEITRNNPYVYMAPPPLCRHGSVKNISIYLDKHLCLLLCHWWLVLIIKDDITVQNFYFLNKLSLSTICITQQYWLPSNFTTLFSIHLENNIVILTSFELHPHHDHVGL